MSRKSLLVSIDDINVEISETIRKLRYLETLLCMLRHQKTCLDFREYCVLNDSIGNGLINSSIGKVFDHFQYDLLIFDKNYSIKNVKKKYLMINDDHLKRIRDIDKMNRKNLIKRAFQNAEAYCYSFMPDVNPEKYPFDSYVTQIAMALLQFQTNKTFSILGLYQEDLRRHLQSDDTITIVCEYIDPCSSCKKNMEDMIPTETMTFLHDLMRRYNFTQYLRADLQSWVVPSELRVPIYDYAKKWLNDRKIQNHVTDECDYEETILLNMLQIK